MSDVKTLALISNDILDLLGKYPNHTKVIVDLVVSFTAGSVRSNSKSKGGSDKKSPSQSTSSKGEAKASDKKSKADPSVDNNSSSSSKEIPQGSISVVNFENHTSNFARCVLSDLAKAHRQKNGALPRMDHKSIRSRVTGARKGTRKALKEYKEVTDASRKTYAGLCLINTIKHFRLVLSDAIVSHVDYVNIGEDLLANMVSVRELEDLQLGILSDGYLQNETTLFWEDPNSVGPEALSPGTQSVVKNPFAC